MGLEDFWTWLGETGNAIYQAFAWPGEYTILQISRLMPDFAAYMSTPANHTTAIVILSLVYWYLVVVLLAIFIKACRNFTRIFAAIAHTLAFRVVLKVGSIKTSIICKYRHRLPWGKSREDTEHSLAEYDKLDVAILKSLVAKGPGFALAAPELAEQFALRPTQVQHSLDKLNGHSMIDTVIGSTDGFDNYRITESGSAFVAMWERQEPHVAERASASQSWTPLAEGQAASR